MEKITEEQPGSVRFSEEQDAFIERYEDLFPESTKAPTAELDIPLVMRRTLLANSKEAEEKLSAEDKAEWLTQSMSHLRLDRENIEVIENLECFSAKLTHLYLQHNRIKHISGLLCLTKLKFLCLSFNKIEHIDTNELPKSIMIIYFDGNPCVNSQGYPMNLITVLPKLRSIDYEPVTQAQRKRAEAHLNPNFDLANSSSDDTSGESDESSSPSDSEEKTANEATGLNRNQLNFLEEVKVGGSNLDEVANAEELLSGEQLQIWRTSYEQVKVLSSSEESDSAGQVADSDDSGGNKEKAVAAEQGEGYKEAKVKKKKKRKKQDKLPKLKTDREKRNLRNLGINPAHFRDLTVKLLGRSRARQQQDEVKHNKKQTKLDSYREEQSERNLANLPLSERAVVDRSNKVVVQIVPASNNQPVSRFS